jgi:adenine C2-methylase RlmN of 23S rRNA A2503 and tRNA A37
MNERQASLELKIDLLLNGVSLKGEFDLSSRAFLNSISDGIHIILKDDIYITATVNKESLFILEKVSESLILLHTTKNSHTVKVVPTGKYFEKKSSDGTWLEDIGTFQTDRLRISAFKGCSFVLKNEGCKFCEASYKRKQRRNKISNIVELVSYCERNEERIKHYLVSGGTPPENGWDHFINVCKAIRNQTNKSIYAMFSPPPTLDTIDKIVDAGVQDVAINLELFNREKSIEFIPGKTKLGFNKYSQSLEYSVKLLGNRGNVKSLLIVGLEDYSDTLNGVEYLAQRGIMPILSIFKPVMGTPLEYYPTPNKDDLIDIWMKSQEICEKYSLTLGPLCKCCQNNTLTIPVNDNYFKYE